MINTGSKDLDGFLEGYDKVTVIYGPAASGKTTLCLLATLQQLKNNKKVLFLDTENGFSIDRFKQLAGDDYKKYLDNVFLFQITNFKTQQQKIKDVKNLIEKGDITLVVVDTIGNFYRRLLKGHKDLANNMLGSQLRILKDIAKKVPVLITNQVYMDIEKNQIKTVGNEILSKNCDSFIELTNNPRKIILRKPDKKEFSFKIVNDGVLKV